MIARLTTSLRDRFGHALFISAALKTSSLSYRQLRVLTRVPSSYDSVSQWQLARAKRREPPLAVERVSSVVADRIGDPFTLGAEALNFLDTRIQELQPSAVLEFGSGVSTVVLAARMAEIHGAGCHRVFSVEENEAYLETTRRMLDDAELGSYARLACRPLRERVIDRHQTTCYDLDDAFLSSFLDIRPEVVVVDGPSGGAGTRFGTLPLVLAHVASPCVFFLDDALREEEIYVASLWRELPQVELSRIHLVGHGLLEGRIVD